MHIRPGARQFGNSIAGGVSGVGRVRCGVVATATVRRSRASPVVLLCTVMGAVVERLVRGGNTWLGAEGGDRVGPGLGAAIVASEPFAVAVNAMLEVGDGGGGIVVGGRVARRRRWRRKFGLFADCGAAAVGFDDRDASGDGNCVRSECFVLGGN